MEVRVTNNAVILSEAAQSAAKSKELRILLTFAVDLVPSALRSTPTTALTVHRTVIHFRGDASLTLDSLRSLGMTTFLG